MINGRIKVDMAQNNLFWCKDFSYFWIYKLRQIILPETLHKRVTYNCAISLLEKCSSKTKGGDFESAVWWEKIVLHSVSRMTSVEYKLFTFYENGDFDDPEGMGEQQTTRDFLGI